MMRSIFVEDIAQRMRCAPSPLEGEGWGGGFIAITADHYTPTANPSPRGGGERGGSS
jgi:hypothetical protein